MRLRCSATLLSPFGLTLLAVQSAGFLLRRIRVAVGRAILDIVRTGKFPPDAANQTGNPGIRSCCLLVNGSPGQLGFDEGECLRLRSPAGKPERPPQCRSTAQGLSFRLSSFMTPILQA
jgi:hypothetical protein